MHCRYRGHLLAHKRFYRLLRHQVARAVRLLRRQRLPARPRHQDLGVEVQHQDDLRRLYAHPIARSGASHHERRVDAP